jgi:membrane protein implicated in regulation of membrane protease activity
MTERPALRRRRVGRVGGILYSLDLILMFLRVAIVTTLWIGLFLGTFFGYLTAPFLVLIVFVVVYAVVDRYRVRARLEAERRRSVLDEPPPEPVYEGERTR